MKLENLLESNQKTKKSRAIDLSIDELIKHIKNGYLENFVETLEHNGILFRGVIGATHSYQFISPSSHTRQSKDLSNHYTYITDMLTNWDGLPRRSLSVVASTSESAASDYGNNIYVVIPKDKHPIAYGTSSDFWTNFKYIKSQLGIRSLEEFAYLMDEFLELYSEKFLNRDFRVKNHEDYYDDLSLLREKILSFAKDNKIDLQKFKDKKWLKNNDIFVFDSSKFMNKLIDAEFDFWEVFSDLFDPVKNKIEKTYSIINLSTSSKYNIECWTDSDCILINKKALQAIKEDKRIQQLIDEYYEK